ncbi:DUF3813 domain-containing protein [Peribacillus asahii]|uniref:DUF3813 domain-containing protein n=1 Tax=Peribacillus asahii TaxID=228899 RepID=UPI00207A31C2|nr:DUF3813 domain-containing protein [Peribacillus asahii]USK71104.1 DUF3813 domain-containing protein [Peribacillus asahii]
MANRLFQEAREFVENVLQSERHESNENHENLQSHENPQNHASDANAVDVAKNALSSAFANSTEAEKEQLRELQQRLEDHLK